ncbi:MAG: immune inhibitor A, partial [Synergistaceae bacterium]|nr:immune inhibitor A [Synergistaceae bacterium]
MNSRKGYAAVLLALFLTGIFSLLGIPPAGAVPVNPGVYTHVQKDGTTIFYQPHGDEFLSYITDSNGDWVAFDFEKDGDIYLARWPEPDEDELDFSTTTPMDEKPTAALNPGGSGVPVLDIMQPPKYPVPEHILDRARRAREERDRMWREQFATPDVGPMLRQFAPLPGTPITRNVLIIYVTFVDNTGLPAQSARPTPQFLHNNLMFADTFGTVAHYFNSVTNGAARVVPAAVNNSATPGIIFVELPGQHLNWGRAAVNDPRYNLVKPALQQASSTSNPGGYVNFANFDANGDRNITADELSIGLIVHGYETSAASGVMNSAYPSIWGHAWEFPHWPSNPPVTPPPANAGNVAFFNGVYLINYFAQGAFQYPYNVSPPPSPPPLLTMGVLAHELGHAGYGFVDVYDTRVSGANKGIGNWSLMAGGSWGAKSNADPAGSTPTGLDAFHMQQFHSPMPQTGSSYNLSGMNEYARIGNTVRPNQYFLLQPRGNTGYDQGLGRWGTWPSSGQDRGILILHVDDALSGSNDSSLGHLRVSVKEAHGGTQHFLSESGETGANDLYNILTTSARYVFDDQSDPTSLLFNANNSLHPPAVQSNITPLVDFTANIDSSSSSRDTYTVTGSFIPYVPVTGITGVPTTASAGTPLTLTGTVNPSNATNQTIAWSVVNAGTTGATISGATFNATAAGTAMVMATITRGSTPRTDYTQNFNITVSAAGVPVITINTHPANTAVTQGSISGSLSVSASVTQGATLSYQWYSNTSNSFMGGTPISGATGASFAIPTTLTVGTYYYFCEARASGGAVPVRSNVATVTVSASGVPVITITTHPANTNVTQGSITGSLSVSASVTQGATLSYQWYSNTSNTSTGGTSISGATGASFTIPTTLTVGTYYYFCEVSATGGAVPVRSNVAAVTVTTGFVPVTNITGVPTTATVNTPLSLPGAGNVVPASATNKTIVWSVFGGRNATITGNTMTATAAGKVTVMATIKNGLAAPASTATTDYIDTFDIVVSASSPAPIADPNDNIIIGENLENTTGAGWEWSEADKTLTLTGGGGSMNAIGITAADDVNVVVKGGAQADSIAKTSSGSLIITVESGT